MLNGMSPKAGIASARRSKNASKASEKGNASNASAGGRMTDCRFLQQSETAVSMVIYSGKKSIGIRDADTMLGKARDGPKPLEYPI